MIKLKKPRAAPECIAGDKGTELLKKYKETKNSVWQIDELKEALLKTSYKKCAYCETKLGVAAAYVEVEHFLHKDKYEDLVVEWGNLLPACRRCNGTKSDHDVKDDPIVNPYTDEPKDHFNFECCRLNPITEIGKTTVDVLRLNDFQKLCVPRFELTEAICHALKNTEIILDRYIEKKTTRRKNDFLEKINKILYECQPHSAYAAFASTVLHSSNKYYLIIDKMKENYLWTNELEEYHANSRSIAFDIQGLIEV